MDAKKLGDFLKPNIIKIIIFLIISILYLYAASEKICGIGLGFTLCFKTWGVPLMYMATGDINAATQLIDESALGNYFGKFGNIMLNPLALLLDALFIYLISCLIFLLFKDMKLRAKESKT